MDKNKAIGIILMCAIFFGYIFISRPSQEEIAQREAQQEQAEAAQAKEEKAKQEAKVKEQQAKEELKNDTASLFHDSRNGSDTTVVLKNEKIEIAIAGKGGMIKSARLIDYKNQEGKDVELFNAKDNNLAFLFSGKNENISTDELSFKAVNATDSSVTMVAEAQNGGHIDFTYTLLPGSYMINMGVQAVGMYNAFNANTKDFDITWNDHLAQQEKGFSFESRYSTITYKKNGKGTDYIGDGGEKTEKIEEALDWVAYKNQFFSYVFIADQNFTNATVASTPDVKGSGYLKTYNTSMKAFFDPSGKKETSFQFYIGPNKYRLLQDMNELSTSNKDLELERLVYLGWPLFRWINRWFTIYVFDFFTNMGLNMGIVLLLLTILMKIITYPFVKKSYMASAKMRVLKPKIDAINEKYKDPADGMKKQQEIMALYANYGANPLGGCLPMLIQMPLWLALFNFVPNAIELRGQSFLWANDLSTYDAILSWDNDLWLIGDHLSLFCILFSASNILYTYMSMRQQRDQMAGQQGAEQMKMMQWMMYIMPFFFFMLNEYSAGLNFYYFINLFLSAAIMWVMRKRTDDAALLAQLEAKYEENKRNPQKKNTFAQRLEAMQKMNEERMNRLKK